MTTNFEEFGLMPALTQSLGRMQITTPTPIQKETIPIALAGSDVLASAQTGTGKTIAYLIPLIMKLSAEPQGSALILAPTRELAMQVENALRQMLGSGSKFNTALIIGGQSMYRQIADLKRRPQVIIGTPGRINDHLSRGTLSLKSTRYLVIDEADRMLDMGFGIQLDQIAEYLPETKQTLMFSATMAPNMERLAQKYLRDPKRISIDTVIKPAPKIKQETLNVKGSEKKTELLKQLNERQGSVIIFVKTRRRADSLAQDLDREGHNTEAMHGDLPQRRRTQVIQMFRNNKIRIIVATDVAARGLDIPHVMHVINFDLPDCPEDYIHRIGRTGRAEAEGFALSLISPDENHKWKAIHRLLNPGAPSPEGNRGDRPPFKKFGNKGSSFGARSKRPFRGNNGGGSKFRSQEGGESSGASFKPKRNFKPARPSGRG